VITFASSVQVSGVRFQQPNSTRRVAIAHEMDFVSPVLVFSCNQISVQVSGFGIYRHLKPETMNRFNLWQSRSPLTPAMRDRLGLEDQVFDFE
jgi:hypothetical protein